MIKTLRSISLLVLCAALLPAQNRTIFGGARNAADYAYGINPNVNPILIDVGNGVTGSAASLTIRFGYASSSDGRQFMPFNVNAPILVGGPTNQETVTPSAVSCSTPAILDSCIVTATFTKLHGIGEPILSGSAGLQEAINLQNAGVSGLGSGGGLVDIDAVWSLYGGTNAIIAAATPFSNVTIDDNRTSGGPPYWTMQPSTLTNLAVPAVLTTASVFSTTLPTGQAATWTAAAVYTCITYVDALGGEGPCGPTYNFTATASVPISYTAPAASTGAVGWRAYAGATYAGAYLLPMTGGGSGSVTTSGTTVTWVSGSQFTNANIAAGGPITINAVVYTVSSITSATTLVLTATAGTQATAVLYSAPGTCTALSTLESVIPACAMTATATFNAIYATTTTFRPNPQTSPTININFPYPQSHTTFAYQPTQALPVPFQSNYGPFVALGSLTSGQTAVLGSVNLPAGYLNTIGRTIRVSGKIALTTLNTATLPYITMSLGWVGGTTAGAPVAVCSLVPAAAGATATANETFTCTMTVNAVGITAIGSIMTNGSEFTVAATGGALTGMTVDTGVAAIGSLGLYAQNTLFITYTSTTNATGGEQLLDLHVETLQ